MILSREKACQAFVSVCSVVVVVAGYYEGVAECP